MGARSYRGRCFGWGTSCISSDPRDRSNLRGAIHLLAGQPASNICGVALVDSSPSQVGFNGILGVGLFPFDGGFYYNCAPLPCTSVAVPGSQQVQNPVGLLPVDNNGVLVALPSVPASGSPSVTGSLILGIGTESNTNPPESRCCLPIIGPNRDTLSSSPGCQHAECGDNRFWLHCHLFQ